MLIQIEETPNPNTLKFIPEVEITKSEIISFSRGDNFSKSPLIKILFEEVDDITNILVSPNFIAITKIPNTNWVELKTIIVSVMIDHISSGHPILLRTMDEESNQIDDEIVKQIKALIDEKVRPAVAEDGGDIIFHSFKEGIVYLEMHGACSGCPSSTFTLKNGIENMLKHYLPEVEAVEAV